MKTKYGFNMLWMYAGNYGRIPEEANERELDFIAEEGFNFIRIPTDYHFWTKNFDYTHPDEKILAYFDRYVEACNSRGLHACLNIHRAPGYCINWPEREKHNLWRDEEAQAGFIYLWKMFAERYRGISSDLLSFDLVNEPANIPPSHPCTREDHAKVIRKTVEAIRSVDPDREIVIDGFNGGGSALPELADLGKQGVVHSGRGYEPFQVTHYKAEWVRGGADWAAPSYPGEVAPGQFRDREWIRNYYGPWREVEAQGVKVSGNSDAITSSRTISRSAGSRTCSPSSGNSDGGIPSGISTGRSGSWSTEDRGRCTRSTRGSRWTGRYWSF